MLPIIPAAGGASFLSIAITTNNLAIFKAAVDHLDYRFRADQERLADLNVEAQLHEWLDGRDHPLPWSDPKTVTPDEWFFVTTLYGRMTLTGQRSHIRSYFDPLFVRAARRDVRNFRPGFPEYAGLRGDWMAARLSTMSKVLRARHLDMAGYVQWLRRHESDATPTNPMPALDAIVRDHAATGWKTLSVFVRDCVGGNSFPIDSRVSKELASWGLPSGIENERMLVRMSLELGAIRGCWRACFTRPVANNPIAI
jgi:hypothetical protein